MFPSKTSYHFGPRGRHHQSQTKDPHKGLKANKKTLENRADQAETERTSAKLATIVETGSECRKKTKLGGKKGDK